MDTATNSRPAEESGRDAAKRRRILAAAQEVFAAQGFEAARMDEVARLARVGKGTLYNYFESKEDLLIQAVIASMEEVQERIAAGVDPSPDQPIRSLEDELRMLVVVSLPALTQRFHSLYNQAAGLIARDSEARQRLSAANQAFYRDRQRDFEELIEAGARAGQFRPDVDPAEVGLLLQAVFDGLLRRATFDPERVEPTRAFDVLLELLRRGLYQAPAARAEGP